MLCLFADAYSSSQETKKPVSTRLSLALMRTGCFGARARTWLKLLSTSWIPVEEFEFFGTKMPFMASLQLTSQERTRRGTWLAEEHINFMYILGLLTKPLQRAWVVLEHYQTVQTGLFQHKPQDIGWTETFGSNSFFVDKIWTNISLHKKCFITTNKTKTKHGYCS